MNNALKFTPGGGRVTLTVDICSSDLVISVEDTGSGFTPMTYRLFMIGTTNRVTRPPLYKAEPVSVCHCDGNISTCLVAI